MGSFAQGGSGFGSTTTKRRSAQERQMQRSLALLLVSCTSSASSRVHEGDSERNGPRFAHTRDALLRGASSIAKFRGRLCAAIKGMATNKTAIKKDPEVFERQARICKAFAHPGRLQMLDLLGDGERRVAELQESLGISKTSISQHMAVLKAVGVLSTRREGRQIYCSLAMPEVKQACRLISKVLQAQIAASHRLVA